MHQLTAAHQLYPPSFFGRLDQLIIDGIKGDPSSFPIIIINPRGGLEKETLYVQRFESEPIMAFGIYVATDIFGYLVTEADLDIGDRLPDELLEAIRQKYKPHLQPSDTEAFEEVLARLDFPTLGQAHLELEDFFSRLDTTIYVMDDWYESWNGFCELYYERLVGQRVTYLSVEAQSEILNSTEHWQGPYVDTLSYLEGEGHDLRHRNGSHSWDEYTAELCYESPIRGGGFTCMN